jgi:soluble lytic murein transglycosylase-like protein
MKQPCLFLLFLIGFVLTERSSFSQYCSYEQEGVRVFTNVPPVGNVDHLICRGGGDAPQAASPAPPNKAEVYHPIIEKYALQHNLDPSLIKSIIKQESGFNPNAISRKGAQGLMQLMPATAAKLGVSNSFDPEQNIQGGVKHFKNLMDSFNNDVTLSLAAYNAGEGVVQRLGRVPDYKETKDYVKSIKKMYESTASNIKVQPEEYVPATFRFVDESGVLHMTNIPPH